MKSAKYSATGKLTTDNAHYVSAMTYSSDTPDQLANTPPARHATAQAGIAISVLLPATIVASYVLSESTGAARPEWSMFITAVIGVIGSLAILRTLSAPHHYPHSRLGACNLVTLLRGAGIALMAGLIPGALSGFGWTLAGFAAVLLALDGVDGWLARRSGLQSPFGARFDVESDVVFALTMGALAVELGHVGPWFLLIGLLRPLFLGAGRLWPALRATLPEAPRRKRIAGLQMGAQVALLTPIAAHPAGAIIAALVLLVTLVSFCIDILWLIRHRGTACQD